jgi:hypothetical protein
MSFPTFFDMESRTSRIEIYLYSYNLPTSVIGTNSEIHLPRPMLSQ